MNKIQFKALIKMGRPFVLVAGLIAYILGLSLAYFYIRNLNILNAIIGLLILITATLMAHYANEYADVDTDSLTRRTWFSGGSGVLPSGIIPPSWALWSAILLGSFCIFLTVTSFLKHIISLECVFIVALGLFGGWFYSMPPLRLERTIWGEVDNALLGGYLMPLIAFIPQLGFFSVNEIFILTPIVLAVMVNLLGVHWADRLADRAVGKKTLVVRLGPKTKTLYLFLLLLIYSISLFLLIIIPWTVVLAIFCTVPLALYSAKNFQHNPMSSSLLMAMIMICSSIAFIFT